jgi:hypothetical protein
MARHQEWESDFTGELQRYGARHQIFSGLGVGLLYVMALHQEWESDFTGEIQREGHGIQSCPDWESDFCMGWHGTRNGNSDFTCGLLWEGERHQFLSGLEVGLL